jgi:hypothetical protein
VLQGLASGLLNSAAQIGTALGLAILIPLSAALSEVLVEGFRLAFPGAVGDRGGWHPGLPVAHGHQEALGMTLEQVHQPPLYGTLQSSSSTEELASRVAVC